MTEETTRHLTDPRAMRALAHPTRLRLLGELRVRGPRTVGMLSDAIDEAVGSVSYHLGKLAEHGFVEEAPSTPETAGNAGGGRRTRGRPGSRSRRSPTRSGGPPPTCCAAPSSTGMPNASATTSTSRRPSSRSGCAAPPAATPRCT